jgi:hypothetical protein
MDLLRRIAAAAFSVVLVGCATSSPPPLPQSAFNPSGPDADEQGARQGYPLGDRATFFRVPYLVGSQSHQDEIFPAHIVHRAAKASPLARAASEPALRYEYQGRPSASTTTWRGTRRPGYWSPATRRSSSSATSTRGPIATGSRRGRWPRR